MGTTQSLNIIIKAIDQATSVVKGVGNSIESFGEKNKATFEGMAGVGGSFLAILGGLGMEAVNVASKFEKHRTVLETLYGSQEKANQAFAMLQDFSARTPYQLDEITGSYVKLMNRGIEPTREELVRLGDLAASQGKGFDQLSEALLDAMTGEFERLKEFGIQASKSGDQVALSFKGVTKEVANTPEAIKGVIQSFGEMQGILGGMEAQSATTAGKVSNLHDSIDLMFNSIGESLKPVIDPLLEKMIAITSAVGGRVEKNPDLTSTMLVLGTATAGLTTAAGLLGLALPAITAGISAMLSPIGLAVSAIGLLAGAYMTNMRGIKDIVDGTMKKIGEIRDQNRDRIIGTMFGMRESIKQVRETHKWWIIGIANGIWEVLTDAFTAISNNISQIMGGLSDVIGGVWNTITGVLTGDWSKAWDGIIQVLTGVKDVLFGIFGAIKDFIVGVFDDIGSFVIQKVENAIKKLKDLMKLLAGGGSESSSSGSDANRMPGRRAVGGNVSSGVGYMVGEMGPEYFVPNVPGKITPKGSAPNVNINISGVTIASGMDAEDLGKTIERHVLNALRDLQLGIA